MINIRTFGSNPAEIRLNELLIEQQDEKVAHWVCATLAKFRQGIAALEPVEREWRQTFLAMLREKYLTLVENRGLPEKIKTFLLNVITTDYRVALERLNHG